MYNKMFVSWLKHAQVCLNGMNAKIFIDHDLTMKCENLMCIH